MPRLVWMFEIAFVVEVVAAAAVVVSKIKHHLEQKKSVYLHFFNYFVISKKITIF